MCIKNIMGATALLSLLAACGAPANNPHTLSEFTTPDQKETVTQVSMGPSDTIETCLSYVVDSTPAVAWCPDFDFDNLYPVSAIAPWGDDGCHCLVDGYALSGYDSIASSTALSAAYDCSDTDDTIGSAGVATYTDGDLDGHGAGTATMVCNLGTSDITSNDDCNDTVAAINPGALEACNGWDDDCDVDIDEGVTITVYADSDGDGHGDPLNSDEACAVSSGWILDATDCNDLVNTTYLGAIEHCDSVDNDCSMVVDDNLTEWSGDAITAWDDGDEDGYGNSTTSSYLVCALGPTQASNNTDCNDGNSGISPGDAEILDNGVDENCDPSDDVTPTDQDIDADGHDDVIYPGGDDCDDNDALNFSGNPEVCDGQDNDCDALVDDADSGITGQTTWYADADGDTYGNSAVTSVSCNVSLGYVASSTDCNDASASINPAATETCDGVDQDCDDVIDDGVATAETYADADLDGYGAGAMMVQCVMDGRSLVSTDCNDSNINVNPAATDVNNDGLDNNCDGTATDWVCFTPNTASDSYDPAAHGDHDIYVQLWIDDMSDGTTDGNSDGITDFSYPGLASGNAESMICGSYPFTAGHTYKINAPFSNTASSATFTGSDAGWWGYMNGDTNNLTGVTAMTEVITIGAADINSWGSGSDASFVKGPLAD